MGTSCAPPLADLLFYSCEADFIQGFLTKNEKKLARSFNFTFHYIDGVLSLNNSRLSDFVDRIYPIELEIKDTTDTELIVLKFSVSCSHNIYIYSGCHLKLSLVFEISLQCCKMFCVDKLNVFVCVKLYMHAICFYIYTSAFL